MNNYFAQSKIRISKVLYNLQYFQTKWSYYPLSLFVKASIRGHESPKVYGIVVHDIDPETKETDFFWNHTRNVLAMIAKLDPIRFRRIQRTLSVVSNGHLCTPVTIWLTMKVCNVDLRRWPFNDYPEWSEKEYACTLIQTATYLRFWEAGIPLTRQTRHRIIKACLREAMQFADRFEDEGYDWTRYFENRLTSLDLTGNAYGDRRLP